MNRNKRPPRASARANRNKHGKVRTRPVTAGKAPRGHAQRPFSGHPSHAFGKILTCEGVFRGTRNGYGFVTPEGGNRDIFIPEDRTAGAVTDDRVRCRYRVFLDRGIEHTEGTVTEIVEAVRTTAVGTVVEERTTAYHGRVRRRVLFVPDDSRLNISVALADEKNAPVGHKVEIVFPPHRTPGVLVGEIIRDFGDALTREANYAAILSSSGIPTDFSDEALAVADEAAKRPVTEEGRADRRGEVIFTVDGAGAKDLDDAVSVTRGKDGYTLGVHIADVSEYVARNTPLEREAHERGTSVYFADRVVPMLPPALSNGACSLNAGEDRPVLSCVMEIDRAGNIRSASLSRGIIRSRVRGVYEEVNDLFENKNSPYREKYREVLPSLTLARELYRILAEKSRLRGALDLDTRESEIQLDGSGFPVEITARERGDAEKMIEQFMLAANESVSTLLSERNLPCVFRIHEPPTKDKREAFAIFARGLGLDPAAITRDEAEARDYRALLAEARKRGLSEAVSYPMLRAMSKAKYSDIRKPHFGLAIDTYCHFTSPIRRLSDLATHRMVKAVLLDGEKKERYLSYARRAAEAATETELRALSAERAIEDLYKALYLSRHIGEVFPATVTSVTRFGAFCMLENGCEGLLPAEDLGEGLVYDEDHARLISRNGFTVAPGDAFPVRVEDCDLSRSRVRFSRALNSR